MNELLQKHGCSAVFTVPEGLKELMGDITREVLRDQPPRIFDYIANYLSVLLLTREHGVMAVKILEDLCDCRASVSEHLLQLGVERAQAEMLSQVIKEEIEVFEPVEGNEKVKETQILKSILTRMTLDEDMSAKVCQVIRNAYRDYWYRKKMMEKNLKAHPDEPWEIAAQHTLDLYKRTKPSFTELTRATIKIQAAYRGYHVRRNVLRHLKPKKKKKKNGPTVELPGPPLNIAASREMDLGPVIDIKVRNDDVTVMFVDHVSEKLGHQYDPMRTITQVDDLESLQRRTQSRITSVKSEYGHNSAQSDVSVEAKQRQTSQVASQIQQDIFAHQSHLPPASVEQPKTRQISAESQHRISFAQTAEVIGADEVPEELPLESPVEADQEVPEDIPDDRTEGDDQSEPTESVSSSAPVTDVEDPGDPNTDEGED